MNEIYEVIRQLVNDGHINNNLGFSARNVREQIEYHHIPHNFQLNSISHSVWKHSIGGGNTPIIYYNRIKRALYMIRQQYL